MTRRLRRIGGDARAVTTVEFAIVAMPMMLAFLGVVDLGFRQYMGSMLQGVMDQAARRVTVGGVTEASINTFVNTQMRRVLPGSNTVVLPQSYGAFGRVKKAEPITTDVNGNGTVDPGDCFTDLNNNGRRDLDGGAGGYGTGDDIVYYTATSSYPAIMPMRSLIGWADRSEVSATIMVRNQPFAGQAQPATVCL